MRIHKLKARTRERSGHENGQENIEGECETVPKISPFKALNEGNDENGEEEPERAISPLYMESRPDLYGVQNETQNETQDADQESSEEVEVELEERPVVKTEYWSE